MIRAYARCLQQYQLLTIKAVMQSFVSRGDAWLPSLPQIVAKLEWMLDHSRNRISDVPKLEFTDSSAKARMRTGFASLLKDLMGAHFVCIPSACPKVMAFNAGGPFDAHCIHRGTGVCNETTEKRMGIL